MVTAAELQKILKERVPAEEVVRNTYKTNFSFLFTPFMFS